MTSLYQQNHSDPIQEPIAIGVEPGSALDSRDREIYALRQQLQALKSLYNKGATVPAEAELSLPVGKPYFGEAPANLDVIRQRNDKMMAVLAERERQMKELHAEFKEYKTSSFNELNREKIAKQTAKDEIVALHGQVEFLKRKYLEGQSQVLDFKRDLENKELECQTLLKESSDAAEVNGHCFALKNELELSKAETKHLAEQFESTSKRLHLAEQRSAENASSFAEALHSIGVLEERLQAANDFADELSQEKAMMQERAFTANSEKEDAEARLKIAHFHLAKKVKETTLLEDQAADLQRQVNETKEDLSEARSQLSAFYLSQENARLEEAKNHQALIASIQNAEMDAKGWKEKYFMGMEKLRQQEQRLSELTLLEEKLLKMKSLWSGFGNFFDDPSSGMPHPPVFERPEGDHQ